MPILSRLFSRSSETSTSNAAASPDVPTRATVNLVSARPMSAIPVAQPPPLGIITELPALPWTVTRIASIFRELARQPSELTLREARFARHCLSLFWLTTPVDQLPSLYAGPVGQIYSLMLEGVLASQPLAPDEKAWRDGLQKRLRDEFDRPERLNLVLAVMPYFPPGGMTVANASSTLPDWLLPDYARFCEPQLELQLRQPVGLPYRSRALLQAPPEPTAETPIGSSASATLANTELPLLTELRGVEAMEQLQGAAYRERMVGLINLYALDQRDPEITAELVQLRRQLGQLWLDVVPSQLEKLFRSPVGDLYRQLLASPFPAAPLSEEDRALRNQLVPLVSDLSRDGALNALLAAMPFFPPQKVELGGGEEFIPAWLMELMQQR